MDSNASQAWALSSYTFKSRLEIVFIVFAQNNETV